METHIINRQGYDLKKGIPTTIQLPKTIYGTKSVCQFETSEFGLNARINVTASGYDSDIPEHLRDKEENRHKFNGDHITDDKITTYPLYSSALINRQPRVNTYDRIVLVSDRDMHVAFSVIENE